MSHSYPSDLSREQFARILPTLESARRRTKPRIVDLYDVFCGVLYLLKSGCQWRMLPADFPDWRTCYKYFRQWSEQPDPEQDSILEQVLKTIGWRGPTKQWEERATSFCIVDSQSVKSRTPPSRRAMAGGVRNQASYRGGHARIAPCDTVTTADVTDRAGALAMFDENRSDLNRVQNVLVDGGYTGKPFAAAVQGILGASVEVVKRTNCTPSWCAETMGGGAVTPGWNRRLWKNCDSIPACKWWCSPSQPNRKQALRSTTLTPWRVRSK